MVLRALNDEFGTRRGRHVMHCENGTAAVHHRQRGATVIHGVAGEGVAADDELVRRVRRL